MRVVLLPLLLFCAAALADDAGILRCRAIAESGARLACYDALVVGAGTKAGSPQAKPRETVEQFGVAQKDRETPLEAIESTIPGHFEGWNGNERLRLANGQVWQVVDDSKGFHSIDNPKVRIRRGLLGAYYLEIEGTNRSPRVQRVK
jgi:hypothetical protein